VILWGVLGCSLLGSVTHASEPVVLYQGTAHDALYDLCLAGQNGVAVGSDGLILQSIDAGESWEAQEPFTSVALLGVSCSTTPRLVVAQQGRIFRWDGQGYKPIASGTEARLLGVDANVNGLAFVVGGFGTVSRSTDGGKHWETLSFDWEAILNDFLEPHLYDVHISAQGVVTIVGEFELVLRSLDGGDTWNTVHKGEASSFGLYLQTDGGGFAVGQDGRVIRTRDGGANWAVVPTPTNAILLNVWSSPGGDVLVSGMRAALQSTDSGRSWNQIGGRGISTGWYQGLSASPDTSVLLAGFRASIIKLPLK